MNNPNCHKLTTILLIDNQAEAFLSHRLPLAKRLFQLGCKIHVATPPSPSALHITNAGFTHHQISLDRGGINPINELIGAHSLFKTISSVMPDIVHLKSPKVWCYGGVACRLLRAPCVVSHVVGLGFASSGVGVKAHLASAATNLLASFSFAYSKQRVIVQNADDFLSLPISMRFSANKIRLVRGSGIDINRFIPNNSPAVPPLVVLPARMLVDKGIREFVAAAAIVHSKMPSVRMALVGDVDTGNPMSISSEELLSWQGQNGVEWWGYQSDMPAVMRAATLVCLPSWREGLPKAILEAMASGKAVVVADTPGTREPVIDGKTGLLVPPRNPKSLANAILSLLTDPARLISMGQAGRQCAEMEFAEEKIIRQTISIMSEMCPKLRRAIQLEDQFG